MSVSCIQTLHQELRIAFRTCALRYQQPSRSQLVSVRQSLQSFRDQVNRRNALQINKTRGYATTQQQGKAGRRRLEDIQREWKRERLRTLKESQEGPQAQAIGAAETETRMPVNSRLLIYHAGTGKTMVVGSLNLFTLLIFAGSCVIVAPAFFASDNPWWTGPLAMIVGSIPMLLIRYTSKSFVPWAHLVLPKPAQRSREAALEYSKNLPDNATIHLAYIRYGLFARRAEVEVATLKPASATFKPVTFRNVDPYTDLGPWWARTPTEFYVSPRSGTGRASKNVVPGVWENVYKRITDGQELTPWRM